MLGRGAQIPSLESRLRATHGEVGASRAYDSGAMSDELNKPPTDLVSLLPERWAELATGICRTLERGGHRGWIVGGAVRDLLLGREIKDVDLVSAARPEEVEALFDRTVAVGKSFGIIVVVLGGEEVELATFRRERGYSDRRRPDEVVYAAAPEEDAERRDFTCNALYLDPLSGEIRDPAGGLADLKSGVLRAVGDPAGRFREDGLRILRMARFHAALDLQPAPGLLAAAQAERSALTGVSAERVRDELQKILLADRAHRAVRVLVDGGHAELVLPPMGTVVEVEARLGVLAALGVNWGDAGAAGVKETTENEATAMEAIAGAAGAGHGEPARQLRWEIGLSVLFGPLECEPEAGDEGPSTLSLVESLDALRCSREERRVVTEVTIGSLELRSLVGRPGSEALSALASPQGAEARGRLIQLWRRPTRAAAAQLALVLEATLVNAGAAGALRVVLGQLEELDAGAPVSPVTLSAGDLQDLGVPRGPLLGALLRRVQLASLGGAFESRAGAMDWARDQLR